MGELLSRSKSYKEILLLRGHKENKKMKVSRARSRYLAPGTAITTDNCGYLAATMPGTKTNPGLTSQTPKELPVLLWCYSRCDLVRKRAE